jgi:amino acid transporter
MAQTTSPGQVSVAQTELKAGALQLPAVVMQSITHIAPAIAALFFIQFIVGAAGLAMPIGYPIGVFLVFLTGLCLVELTRAMPSAGGYYTYVARGINARAGFLTAWIYMLFSPANVGPVLVFAGSVFAAELGLTGDQVMPFSLACLVVGACVVALVQYRGIQISGKTMVILGVFELIVVSVLGLWGFLTPGPGGFNLAPLNPSTFFAAPGFAIGILFAIQAMTGWEASAPLAEESTNPSRNVPIAIVGSIIGIGVFLTVVTFGFFIGWGTDRVLDPVDGLAAAPRLPGLILAKQYWGVGEILPLLAILSSTIAVSLACSNVSTRMWFKMGQTGTLPRSMAKLSPYKTPVNAIIAQLILTLAVGFGLTLWLGVSDQYFFVGTFTGASVLFIYVFGNISVYRIYSTERRAEYNVVRHLVIPVVSTLAMLWVGYEILTAIPAGNIGLAIPFTGAWIVVGVVIAALLSKDAISRAGDSVEERPATAGELADIQGEW